ncbi:MAG: response regulator [Armatimonadia bacterium]
MPRVLLVEDDPQVRMVLRKTLKDRGFRCDEAENGRVGLHRMCEATAEDDPYDFVLLDIIMPEVDGWQFLQAVKANPLWSPTRCVVLSGRAVSSKDIARASMLDCVHIEKRGCFMDTIGAMLTRMVASVQ